MSAKQRLVGCLWLFFFGVLAAKNASLGNWGWLTFDLLVAGMWCWVLASDDDSRWSA
jgi:hypothetical protein